MQVGGVCRDQLNAMELTMFKALEFNAFLSEEAIVEQLDLMQALTGLDTISQSQTDLANPQDSSSTDLRNSENDPTQESIRHIETQPADIIRKLPNHVSSHRSMPSISCSEMSDLEGSMSSLCSQDKLARSSDSSLSLKLLSRSQSGSCARDLYNFELPVISGPPELQWFSSI